MVIVLVMSILNIDRFYGAGLGLICIAQRGRGKDPVNSDVAENGG